MERKKYLSVMLALMMGIFAHAQNNVSIYKAFVSGDMLRWRHAMDSLAAAHVKTNRELLDLINYQYGYIAWCLTNKKHDDAERYLSRATENVALLEKRRYSQPTLDAYRAAFIGFEIGLSPYKAPFIGGRSHEYAQKSVSADSGSILGFIQLGNIMFYKPKVLGGSKTEALKYFQRAEQLFDRNERSKRFSWNYLNLMVSIINTYVELKQYDAAKRYCIKALTCEPGFAWVRNNLYVQVLKKIER